MAEIIIGFELVFHLYIFINYVFIFYDDDELFGPFLKSITLIMLSNQFQVQLIL